jgi:hypothetical protein
MRMFAIVIAMLFLAGCRYGANALSDETRAKLKAAYDEMLVEREPLCIDAGPFPFHAGHRTACDACQALGEAGLLERHTDAEQKVSYTLTELGKPLYREEPDDEYVELVRERFRRQKLDRQVDEKALARPRMCFGTTRFHHIEEALPPMSLSGNQYLSVKIVAEAKDDSGLLRDARLAPLNLPLPPAPADAAAPLLYPPRVATFEFVPGDPEPALSDMRYGAWVDEK